jgi:hypothetical protein
LEAEAGVLRVQGQSVPYIASLGYMSKTLSQKNNQKAQNLYFEEGAGVGEEKWPRKGTERV